MDQSDRRSLCKSPSWALPNTIDSTRSAALQISKHLITPRAVSISRRSLIEFFSSPFLASSSEIISSTNFT